MAAFFQSTASSHLGTKSVGIHRLLGAKIKQVTARTKTKQSKVKDNVSHIREFMIWVDAEILCAIFMFY
jgi:hypothetical protein